MLGPGPELRDIAEIFGIDGDLLEQPPSGFDGGQILLALIFSSAFANHSHESTSKYTRITLFLSSTERTTEADGTFAMVSS
jgi:hypothetical protein